MTARTGKFKYCFQLAPVVQTLDNHIHWIQTLNLIAADSGRFPFVRTGRLDHCPTSRFDNEIRFFQEFLLNNHFLGAYYLGFDWSGWRDLIGMEIRIALGMIWPVSSDKWRAPSVTHFSEPVRPALSPMLTDMISDYFISIFVTSIHQWRLCWLRFW